MEKPIYIRSLGSITPLGIHPEEILSSYRKPISCLEKVDINNGSYWVGRLPKEYQGMIERMQTEGGYRQLDPSVLYGMLAARLAVENAGWQNGFSAGVNMASSRGATQSLEMHFAEFIERGRSHVLSSPSTTLGNLAYWIAHDLDFQGPAISHSITCSSALHAVLNGVAWIQSGLSDHFLAGGTEAALTNFTMSQMQAMKIYSESEGPFPCRAMDMDKSKNTMVMGEGASVACLQGEATKDALSKITGIGYGREPLEHAASISDKGNCLQDAMRMALKDIDPAQVDVVITHAPGTLQGDRAEWRALEAVFGDAIPAVTNNKWKLGHTFGASGMISLEMGVYMIQHQEFYPIPYLKYDRRPEKINKVLVNAVGFGSNAVSILLEGIEPK